MDRRDFLRVSGLAWVRFLETKAGFAQARSGDGKVMTVLGPISPDEFGSPVHRKHSPVIV